VPTLAEAPATGQQLVLEVLARLDGHIGSVDGKIDRLDQRVREMEGRVASKEDVRSIFNDHEARLRSLTEYRTRAETEAAALVKKDTDQEARIRSLESFKERAYGIILLIGVFASFLGAGVVKLMNMGTKP
jgi:chromosome segregation ATPase